jgi:hypothetical protein
MIRIALLMSLLAAPLAAQQPMARDTLLDRITGT